MTFKPLSECRLYTFVDAAYLRGKTPESIARQLCEGGSDLIQLRAKGVKVEAIAEVALRLAPITRAYGVRLVINDHPSVARQAGADLCHLGQEDFFDAGHVHAAELRTGSPGLGIGLSTHSPDQAVRALKAGADYIAAGPIYPTGTKPTAAPVTLEYVRWAASHIEIPWFAIGGITLTNLKEVLGAGASRICVVSAILNADDVAGACKEFRRRLPP